MSDSRPPAVPPNFAARRMLVSAAAITLVVVAVSAVWQQVRGDDTPPAPAPASWDAVAFVDSGSGDVVVLEPDGTVVARHDGSGRVNRIHSAGSRVALVRADSVSLVDLAADGDPDPIDVTLPERSRSVTRLATSRDRLMLAAGNRNGGEIRLIDGQAGVSYDVADLAGLRDPLLYTGTLRVDPQGTAVAVADAASFQTVALVGLGTGSNGNSDEESDEDAPVVENYADQPLAIDGRVLATTQVVGGRADVSVHPLGGQPSAPVPMGIPAGGMITDGRLLAVTTDGSVVAIRVGDRQPRQLATLTLPPDATVTAAYPAAGGTRMVVYADSYVAVVDTEGEVLYEQTFSATGGASTSVPTSEATATSTVASSVPGSAPNTSATADTVPGGTSPALAPPADAPIEPAEPLPPAWEWTCLAVGLGTRSSVLISLEDGAELARLSGVSVTATSADGCTLLGTTGEATVVVGAAGRASLGAPRMAALSPDGRFVVRRAADRTTELVPLDDELRPGDAIDVTEVAPASTYSVAFVER